MMRVRALALFGAVVLLASPALAADETPAEPARPAADIQGFRSAHFGMTEDQVRGAIAKDFNLKGDAIKSFDIAAEHTHALSAVIADLIPGGGKAEVDYVFGYKTHLLIQIGVTWSHETDAKVNPDLLYANGIALQALFTSQAYKEGSVAVNAGLANPAGVLMFRGDDAKGHRTQLLLLGTVATGKDGKQSLTATSLNLYYLADPEHPDVLKLQPGQF